jgi:hypothetical protein
MTVREASAADSPVRQAAISILDKPRRSPTLSIITHGRSSFSLRERLVVGVGRKNNRPVWLYPVMQYIAVGHHTISYHCIVGRRVLSLQVVTRTTESIS